MTSSVDVLVPVHSAQRPIARLAASVLGTSVPIRLVVVAHDVDASAIRTALGEHAEDPRVQVLAFQDGVRSPAGPLRFALKRLESPFFMKIDSDDFLADGAIESWMRTQRRYDADIVLPSMRMVGTRRDFPTPPRRPFRTRLDPVRDRLAYRTSTMGLIRAELARDAYPEPGLRTAEDLAPGLRLWFSDARIVAADPRYAYMVAPDAGDRVTLEQRPLADDLAFIEPLVREPFWARLDQDARVGIVAKLLRVQVIGALAGRADRHLTASEVAFAGTAARALVALAPRVGRVLSRDEATLFREVLAGAGDESRITRLASRASRHLSLGGLVTPGILDSVRRDAPVRYLGASVLARYRR
ncbi:glycosyltransferase [Leifsonia naganoensis]|uniref:Putative membrane protein n=1 Tax=Leifsonia naganoensis TaxID=150025 RepID=A0A853DWW0_9MICO|nr:glycosyltransferase [Leifsonia naganoensis]NYK10555.1 putative membrane protein [Leifsonia naganoensis]